MCPMNDKTEPLQAPLGRKKKPRVTEPLLIELVSVAEAAILLNKAEKTIRNWMALDRLPYVKIGGSVSIKLSVIHQLIADGTVDNVPKKPASSIRTLQMERQA